MSGWESKLKRCGEGEQKWGLFIAEKASSVVSNGVH